jgi:hypothetical protein
MRTRRLVLGLALALAACTVAPAGDGDPESPDPGLVAVAQDLCPVLWRWQLAVGGIANRMSAQTLDEPDPAVRARLYEGAVAEIRDLNGTLADQVRTVGPGPYSAALVTDVLDGLAMSNGVLDDLETRLATVEGPPRAYMASVFHSIEKVIDLTKPELSVYRDDAVIRAFLTVPHCQHGVKDADDGVARFLEG